MSTLLYILHYMYNCAWSVGCQLQAEEYQVDSSLSMVVMTQLKQETRQYGDG